MKQLLITQFVEELKEYLLRYEYVWDREFPSWVPNKIDKFTTSWLANKALETLTEIDEEIDNGNQAERKLR